nr:hypothetical protein Q903MT_gene5352 [Picea sitchensis]
MGFYLEKAVPGKGMKGPILLLVKHQSMDSSNITGHSRRKRTLNIIYVTFF